MMSHAGTCCHDMCIIKSAFYHIYPNPKFPFIFFYPPSFLFHIFLPLFIELNSP